MRFEDRIPRGARCMARPLYGGQAVLEGVMMRGHRHVAVAVRHPKGHIVTCADTLPPRFLWGIHAQDPITARHGDALGRLDAW